MLIRQKSYDSKIIRLSDKLIRINAYRITNWIWAVIYFVLYAMFVVFAFSNGLSLNIENVFYLLIMFVGLYFMLFQAALLSKDKVLEIHEGYLLINRKIFKVGKVLYVIVESSGISPNGITTNYKVGVESNNKKRFLITYRNKKNALDEAGIIAKLLGGEVYDYTVPHY